MRIHYQCTQKNDPLQQISHRVFNEDADREFRQQELRTENMVNRGDFHSTKLNVSPSIDLLESRLITQLPDFASYRPGPESKALNALTKLLLELKFYAFPLFLCVQGNQENMARWN